MAEAFDAAGLPQECVLHGIRKAAARRLAEAGCSTRQIMAITGHKSFAEVARYTREAEQERGAAAAIALLEEHKEDENSQTTDEKFPHPGKSYANQEARTKMATLGRARSTAQLYLAVGDCFKNKALRAPTDVV